jgi:carbon storage regulator CsrA
MLVLTRKKKESIVIDGRITVTVIHVQGNTIRLGIEAGAASPAGRTASRAIVAADAA